MSNLQNSGAYWLGEIPKDWKMLPAWALFAEGKEKCLSDDPHLVPSRVYGVVTRDRLAELSGNKPVDNEASAHHMKHVEPHNFIISMGSHESGIEHSRLVGKVSNDYRVLLPTSGVNPEYYKWFFKSEPLIEGLRGLTTEIRVGQRIHYSRFSLLRLPLPPAEDQQRIADYLDRETAEIDAAVADLDRYVELLELRARMLIKQQLSGDHPQVKMGLLADAIIGITYSPNDVVEEGGTKVYRSGNVQDSRINRQNMLAVNVEIPPHLRFQEDDILMCSRNGSANLVGKNAIVGPEDLGHTWGAFMTVIRSDLNRYLFWFFRSPQFDAHRGLFSTSTINQLTTGILNRIPVPLPPRGRRDEIVKALELEVEEIDALIAESIKLRDLLLRRRSVLITEVVTGRKRV